jgi:hypothetical protein
MDVMMLVKTILCPIEQLTKNSLRNTSSELATNFKQKIEKAFLIKKNEKKVCFR